ncbi:hypothetical protein [Streptomyces sp. B27]|uniref:hypothetical protein n=1 Tax=Streptomyces sp. B27 TaxID=2485015 RepID=UPI0013E317E6|nr:hypothetical protein [Streptomyces sp. B27]
MAPRPLRHLALRALHRTTRPDPTGARTAPRHHCPAPCGEHPLRPVLGPRTSRDG